MESSHLRIGNYVYVQNGKLLKQEKGERTQLYKIENVNIQSAYKYDPIPITEQWLLDFAFLNGIEEMTLCDENICIYWRKFESHFEINGEKYFKKYIHQLQNLYFALTEKELILKP